MLVKIQGRPRRAPLPAHNEHIRRVYVENDESAGATRVQMLLVEVLHGLAAEVGPVADLHAAQQANARLFGHFAAELTLLGRVVAEQV